MGEAPTALIYNPRAGRLIRERHRFEKAVEVLRERWPQIELIETTGPRTAGELAKAAAAAGAGLVIACGGDGTVNEVVQSMSGSEVPVGILPGGTANVLSNEMRLGNDMVKAARALSDAEAHSVATGLLRQGEASTRFVLMAGIGFDALLVHKLDLAIKERWGKLAYWWAAIRELGTRLDLFEVLVNGDSIPSTFTLVSRVRNYGGDVSIARDASLLSGEFEVIVFETQSVVRLAWLLAWRVLTGRLESKRDVTVLTTRRLELRSGVVPIHVQVDGEAAGFLPATIEIVPDSLRLLMPREWLRRERARIGS